MSAPLDEAGVMIVVLGLVDVEMIATLLIMGIIGGYEAFVSRIRLGDHPDRPEWLSHVNANLLEIELSMPIIGISSIHLLVGGENVTLTKRGDPPDGRHPSRLHTLRKQLRAATASPRLAR